MALLQCRRAKNWSSQSAGDTPSTPLLRATDGVWWQPSDSHTLLCRRGWPVRKYPWGVVEPMSSAHSDLLSLRNLLFQVSPEPLKVETEQRYLKSAAVEPPASVSWRCKLEAWQQQTASRARLDSLVQTTAWCVPFPGCIAFARGDKHAPPERISARLRRLDSMLRLLLVALAVCGAVFLAALLLACYVGAAREPSAAWAPQTPAAFFAEVTTCIRTDEPRIPAQDPSEGGCIWLQVSAVLDETRQEPAALHGLHPSLVSGMSLIMEDLVANFNLTVERRRVYQTALQLLGAPHTTLVRSQTGNRKRQLRVRRMRDWGCVPQELPVSDTKPNRSAWEAAAADVPSVTREPQRHRAAADGTAAYQQCAAAPSSGRPQHRHAATHVRHPANMAFLSSGSICTRCWLQRLFLLTAGPGGSAHFQARGAR